METEQGWKIRWDVFHHPPAEPAAEGEQEHSGFLHRLGDRLTSLQHSLGGRLASMLPHFGHHAPAAEQAQGADDGSPAGAKPPRAPARASVDVLPLPKPPLGASGARGPARAASLPTALDAAPLYELHHHHRPPAGIPMTITEGALLGAACAACAGIPHPATSCCLRCAAGPATK